MISLTALLIVFAAVIGSASMMGVIAYLLHRIRQVEGRASDGLGPGGPQGQLEGLQEDLLGVQEQLSALTERLDFTEKLLMKGDDPGPLDPPG